MGLTQQRALDLFHYDPNTGIVTARIGRVGVRKGAIMGNTFRVRQSNLKYINIGIDNKEYRIHRVIWLMTTGMWPKHQIDHINGIGTDNRWDNLRDVSGSENKRNTPLYRNNKSGICGVLWRKVERRWLATVRNNNKTIHLYYGDDFFEACCRRKSAELKYGYHENHGRLAA